MFDHLCRAYDRLLTLLKLLNFIYFTVDYYHNACQATPKSMNTTLPKINN